MLSWKNLGLFLQNHILSTAVVDGFTIQGGYGLYDDPNWYSVGGGIKCDSSSSPSLINNTISGNSASSGGGGIYCYYSSPTISNNTISGNSATSGGGIECYRYSNPTISNNTITGNSAYSGGGILCEDYSSPSISNTIIAFSSLGEGVYCEDTNSIPTLTCCDVYGNAGGDWVGCIADQADLNGNFSADPLFCDTAAVDFSLSKFSPCLPQYNSCGVLIGSLDLGCTGPYICGDANGDSVVTMDDVAFLQAFYFDCSSCPDPLVVADLNCDGSVDIADIVYLAQFLNGTGPEPCCW